MVVFYFVLSYFTYADSSSFMWQSIRPYMDPSPQIWWMAQLLSSARQTERLDHLSFTWQQQKSWNCRKQLLGDKGNCLLTMKNACGSVVKRQLNRILFWTCDGRKWV